MISNHISNKEHVSRLHKELSGPNNKKKTQLIKGERFEQVHHQEKIKMPNNFLKIAQHNYPLRSCVL